MTSPAPGEPLPQADDRAHQLPKLETGTHDLPEQATSGPSSELARNRSATHLPHFQRYQPPQAAPQPSPSPQGAPSSTSSPDEPKSATSGPLAKTQTVFIHKLYDMLEDPTLSHLIWWSPTNDSFCLYPGEEFSNVLAQYFKHTNIASFIRQLNMYGFHKVNDSFQTDEKPGSGSAVPAAASSSAQGPQTQTRWEFRHAANQFRKGDTESLRLIKRKSSKVVSMQKEIVSLKSLPPTSNPSNTAASAQSDTEASETPEAASKQQYHLSLYQQSWKQQSVPQQLSKPHTPSSPKGQAQTTPTSSGQVYYAGHQGHSAHSGHGHPVHGYQGYIHSMPVPSSPSSPPFPDHAMPTPSSYVSQAQSRQPSNQATLGLEQSINLKLIEMNHAISNLRASYDDLQRRHDHLQAGYYHSQHEMVMLVDILEKQMIRDHPTGEHPERTKTPANESTPGPEQQGSLLSELKAFKKQLHTRLSHSESVRPESAFQRGPDGSRHGSTQGPSHQGAPIVPEHYPLNPNYSLYNTAENGFRHFRLSSDETHQNRHFSVLMDPLQPKAFKSGEDSKSTTPLPAPTAKDSRTSQMPIVQQYQPKVSQQATPALYSPYLRDDGSHQQRTVSLPILDKAIPPSFSHQRHSTTALLNPSDDRRPSSPGRSLMMGSKSLTSNPMKTSAPLGSTGRSRATSPSSLSAQPQMPFGVAGESKGSLPSVKELDMSIKRSASGRLSEILSHDSDVRTKKKKTE